MRWAVEPDADMPAVIVRHVCKTYWLYYYHCRLLLGHYHPRRHQHLQHFDLVAVAAIVVVAEAVAAAADG